MFRLASSIILFSAFTFAVTTDALAYQKGGAKGKNKKANDGVITNWGKPPGYGPGKVNAYWIWHDDGMWRFRTTGGGKGSPRFQGTIEVIGGQLAGVKGLAGETQGKLSDRYVFTSNQISFNFKTNEGQDGLNFLVTPGTTAIRYSLAINGESHPKHIRIGKAGDHPGNAVFTTPGNPPDSGK